MKFNLSLLCHCTVTALSDLHTKHSGWNFLNMAVMQRPEIGLRHMAHSEPRRAW